MRVLALPACRCWIDVLPGNTAEGLGGQRGLRVHPLSQAAPVQHGGKTHWAC
jgi:hypothetical protein